MHLHAVRHYLVRPRDPPPVKQPRSNVILLPRFLGYWMCLWMWFWVHAKRHASR